MACEIGNDVEIGPYAVLRGSIIGDGAKIEEYATSNISVIGPGARIGRYGMANLCVLYGGSMISHGRGYQASIIGANAFVAWGVTAMDLSFGKEVKVETDEGWKASGQHFLGVAIGHRAAVGAGVCLNFGVSVPNDALLVGPIDHLIRDASAAQPKLPYKAEAGKVVPIKKSGRISKSQQD